MRLGRRFGDDRLEAACRRALAMGAWSSKSIASRLPHDLDRRPLPAPPRANAVINHAHLRGPKYYHSHRSSSLLTHPPLEKLPALRLTGMRKALSEQMQMPDIGPLHFEERLGLLVDREMTARSDRRLHTRLRQAK
jgi:IstB-like ATP binding protein